MLQIVFHNKKSRVKHENAYSFDITKVNQIFNLLLADKIIKQLESYNIEELKKLYY